MEQGFDNFRTEAMPEPVGPAEESGGSEFWTFVRDVLETLVLAIIMFLVINTVSARVRVDGSSMAPTLADGQ
ncbi:MAG TPA: hypothetical protein EYP88_05195, partial [Anaerolineales bacterium]|nr:hypothetical protein [Anaerolineales bacterium]